MSNDLISKLLDLHFARGLVASVYNIGRVDTRPLDVPSKVATKLIRSTTCWAVRSLQRQHACCPADVSSTLMHSSLVCSFEANFTACRWYLVLPQLVLPGRCALTDLFSVWCRPTFLYSVQRLHDLTKVGLDPCLAQTSCQGANELESPNTVHLLVKCPAHKDVQD